MKKIQIYTCSNRCCFFIFYFIRHLFGLVLYAFLAHYFIPPYVILLNVLNSILDRFSHVRCGCSREKWSRPFFCAPQALPFVTRPSLRAATRPRRSPPPLLQRNQSLRPRARSLRPLPPRWVTRRGVLPQPRLRLGPTSTPPRLLFPPAARAVANPRWAVTSTRARCQTALKTLRL